MGNPRLVLVAAIFLPTVVFTSVRFRPFIGSPIPAVATLFVSAVVALSPVGTLMTFLGHMTSLSALHPEGSPAPKTCSGPVSEKASFFRTCSTALVELSKLPAHLREPSLDVFNQRGSFRLIQVADFALLALGQGAKELGLITEETFLVELLSM